MSQAIIDEFTTDTTNQIGYLAIQDLKARLRENFIKENRLLETVIINIVCKKPLKEIKK